MIKKLMLAVATLVASMGIAFAQVDVNKADAAALDSVKGVGPSHVEGHHRRAHQGRSVQGLGRLPEARERRGRQARHQAVEAGLQVNGKSKDGAPMTATSGRQGRRQGRSGGQAAKAGARPADAEGQAGRQAGSRQIGHLIRRTPHPDPAARGVFLWRGPAL
jgi:competence protein ComEA